MLAMQILTIKSIAQRNSFLFSSSKTNYKPHVGGQVAIFYLPHAGLETVKALP